VPEYRRRFFELLETALSSQSIRMTIEIGAARGEQASRGDAVDSLPMVRRVPTRSIEIRGRRVDYKRLSPHAASADLVIVDQALRHLETYLLLARQPRRAKVALWGHGVRQAKRASRAERLFERRVTRAAHWFFAYTEGGAERLARTGFPRERITIVQNTIDVESLANLRGAVSTDDRVRLGAELDLPPRNVTVYIGALDPSKRIKFLLESCAIVASQIPDFVLVVAGDGPDRSLVEQSLSAYPWLRYVGRADDRMKAALGAVSDALLMPGSVGLVAVDSFALRTPIVTTRWPHHGPEAEYLEDGVNARISDDDIGAFSRLVTETLADRDGLARLADACAEAAPRYSLDAMVAKYASGVVAALSEHGR
jgi:glycosyltransferase involved in cell wall biosynthesis